MRESAQTYVFLGMPAIVSSDAMRGVIAMVRRVAALDASVLITGGSGSGKELVARALHHYSARSERPWVDVSCPTLPEHLVESELFGHEKGAYSSADSAKPGLFEMADGGTLFLDEVGELDPRMQVKLLRVLDGGTFFRLGGTKRIQVNVRVIAATNQDLAALSGAGKFRSDLYHRLSQIQIEVPPLRERPEDILSLAEYFLEQYRPGGVLRDDARRALLAYRWPGNVRELRNVLVKAAVFSPGHEIGARSLPDQIFEQPFDDLAHLAMAVSPGSDGEAVDWNLEMMERRMISQVLERTGGHQQKAADLLGISRRTLSRKLRSYALEGGR